MTELAQHPHTLWRSEAVTELLADFFAANFNEAGISPVVGREIIGHAWQQKDIIPYETLRKQINKRMIAASDAATVKPNEGDPLDLVDLTEAETLLDYGANKLTTLNYFAKKYPHLKELIAIDVTPQRKDFIDPSRSRYITVTDDTTTLPLVRNSVDVVHAQFVLHHFPNEKAIKSALRMCHEVLRPGSRFYLWEETFTDTFTYDLYAHNNQDLCIRTDETFTERFYALSEVERWQFIAANDWFINVSNAHMQWTGQYRPWLEWVALFDSTGFSLLRSENLGLRINGRLKQGVHMLGVFQKT